MDAKLKKFIAKVTENANSIEDIGKKALRSATEYKALRKTYTNLDDVIAEIYKRAPTLGIYKRWVEERWAYKRLRISHQCRGEGHKEYAIELVAELRKEHPAFAKRLSLKYSLEGLLNVTMRVVCSNPWSVTDVTRMSDQRIGIVREKEFYEKMAKSEKGAIEDCKKNAEDARPYASGDTSNYYQRRT